MNYNYAYTIRITDKDGSLNVCVLSDDKMTNGDLYMWAQRRFNTSNSRWTMEILSKATKIEIK